MLTLSKYIFPFNFCRVTFEKFDRKVKAEHEYGNKFDESSINKILYFCTII